MTNINSRTQIKCHLIAGSAYQSRMSLTVSVNEEIIYSTEQIDDEKLNLEFVASLPMTVTFKVGGKDISDTEVDDNGNIIRDKCVILDALCINGMWVKRWMLENKLVEFVADDGKKITHNYFGKNGLGKFAIPHTNLLEFWLDTMTVDQ